MSAARRLVKHSNKGFTLVEILIVVIILGILAAIVIPQFTSASDDARKNSLTSQVQTMRSQIELYKLQHTSSGSELFATAADQWREMTGKTDIDGTLNNTTGKFGPYLQTVPANNMSGLTKVALSTTANEQSGVTVIDATAGFVYNTVTGKFFGLDKAGKVYLGG